jgi:ABC-type glycerol-3-phosphate transport system permease component
MATSKANNKTKTQNENNKWVLGLGFKQFCKSSNVDLAKYVSSIWYSMVIPMGIYLFLGKTLVERLMTQETAVKLKVNILDWSKS